MDHVIMPQREARSLTRHSLGGSAEKERRNLRTRALSGVPRRVPELRPLAGHESLPLASGAVGATYGQPPARLSIDHTDGVFTYTSDGHPILNAGASTVNLPLGHRHQEPLAAQDSALERIDHVSGLFTTEIEQRPTEKPRRLAPMPDSLVHVRSVYVPQSHQIQPLSARANKSKEPRTHSDGGRRGSHGGAAAWPGATVARREIAEPEEALEGAESSSGFRASSQLGAPG